MTELNKLCDPKWAFSNRINSQLIYLTSKPLFKQDTHALQKINEIYKVRIAVHSNVCLDQIDTLLMLEIPHIEYEKIKEEG